MTPPYAESGDFFTEADTRAKLIDPKLYQRDWTEAHIRREQTAGTIELTEDGAERLAPGRIDYVLRLPVSEGTQPVPVAYVEAKRENALPESGIEQAQSYQKRLHVAFVFSTNGHQFVEYDAHSGLTSQPRPLEQFPTPAELRERYERIKGFQLSSPRARALLMPYARGEATRRYYQDAAIRAVLEKIAERNRRIPVPDLSTQTRIVRELSEQLSAARTLKMQLSAQLAALDRYPAALLREAFAGRL